MFLVPGKVRHVELASPQKSYTSVTQNPPVKFLASDRQISRVALIPRLDCGMSGELGHSLAKLGAVCEPWVSDQNGA